MVDCMYSDLFRIFPPDANFADRKDLVMFATDSDSLSLSFSLSLSLSPLSLSLSLCLAALLQPGEGVEEKSCSELGLRHKLSVLRPELVTKFIRCKYTFPEVDIDIRLSLSLSLVINGGCF